MPPKIKIHFLKGGQGNGNTASNNRFLMLQQMTAMNFEIEVIGGTTHSKEKLRNNKWVNALYFRLNIFKGALIVPASCGNRFNLIFLLSTDPVIFLFIWMIARFKGIKIINERNEFPETIRKGIPWRILFYRIFVIWWQYKLIDGLFLMTDELIRFYSPFTRKKCVIQKLPMTVDFTRFGQPIEQGIKQQYIFYAGSLSQKKDGVQSLIRAFKIVEKTMGEMELWLAGGKKQSNELQEIKSLISTLNLNEKVKLLGELDRDVIPGYLQRARMLVLPRPDSIQARGGFPTKLGEYLASGRPVIATRVGEIPLYLTEQEAFLISPEKIEKELAERFLQIHHDYDHALKVAEAAKAKAFECFSIEANAEKVKELILKIA